jgi:hypothetical protein
MINTWITPPTTPLYEKIRPVESVIRAKAALSKYVPVATGLGENFSAIIMGSIRQVIPEPIAAIA